MFMIWYFHTYPMSVPPWTREQIAPGRSFCAITLLTILEWQRREAKSSLKMKRPISSKKISLAKFVRRESFFIKSVTGFKCIVGRWSVLSPGEIIPVIQRKIGFSLSQPNSGSLCSNTERLRNRISVLVVRAVQTKPRMSLLCYRNANQRSCWSTFPENEQKSTLSFV